MTAAEVAIAYLRALSEADVEAALALVADDFYNEHTSALGVSVRGKAAYAERLPGFLQAFTGLRYEVEDVIAEEAGDGAGKVAVPYTLRAVVDGRPLCVRGMFRFTIAGGRLVHRVDYWDSADAARQLDAKLDR